MDNTIAVIPKSVIIADSLLNVFLSTSDYSISGKEKEDSLNSMITCDIILPHDFTNTYKSWMCN